MKTCLQIIILLALVMATSVSAAQVTSIGLAHENGGTVIRIDLQGPFQFTHTSEAPKDGKPDRLIVDIIGATHTWGPKEWASLPACGVNKLRIGQYSSKPEKVVRVVLELPKSPVYQADSDGKSIKIRLTDSSVKPFAVWTTGPAPAAPPVVPVPPTAAPAVASTQPAAKPTVSTPAPTVAAAPKPTTPAVAVAPKAESTPAPKPAPHSTLAQQPPVQSKPAQPTAPATKPAPTPTANVTAPKPVVANPPATKPAPAVASTDTKPTSVQPTTPAAKPAVTAPKTEAKPTPTVASSPYPAPTAPKPAASPQTAQTAPVSKPAPAVAVNPAAPTVAQTTPAAKPTQLAKVEQFKPQPTTVATTEKPAQPSVPASKPAAPTVAVTTPPATSAPTVKPTDAAPAAKPVTENKGSGVKPPEKPVLAEADDAAGSSTPARQTARFRRNASASAKMKSSLVAEFPQRLVIKYENLGYRDPFATLIDDTRTYDTPIEKRLANVEGLRLVGILESASGDNRALFQDKRNFSYMLKAGDKVEKGYVLRVENDKVYFQIFEYGWSRTVALTFDNRN